MRPAADAVVKALGLVGEGKDAAALQAIADIPRSSPYACWKLFVRGLVAYYAGERSDAEANWSKLPPERRPARIAAVLLADAATPTADGETAKAVERLQKLRQLRPAMAAARRIVAAVRRQADRPFSR